MFIKHDPSLDTPYHHYTPQRAPLPFRTIDVFFFTSPYPASLPPAWEPLKGSRIRTPKVSRTTSLNLHGDRVFAISVSGRLHISPFRVTATSLNVRYFISFFLPAFSLVHQYSTDTRYIIKALPPSCFLFPVNTLNHPTGFHFALSIWTLRPLKSTTLCIPNPVPTLQGKNVSHHIALGYILPFTHVCSIYWKYFSNLHPF